MPNFLKYSLKSVIISLLFSIISILIFALILRLCSIPEVAIKPVNYVIKTVAVFLGVFFSVRNEKGLLKGVLLGVVITVICNLVFSLLCWEFLITYRFLWDLLLGATVGGVSGILGVNVSSK